MLHLNQAGFQAIRGGAALSGIGLGLGVGHDARLVALGDDAEAMGGHHREEQLIDFAQAQRGARHDTDLAFDPRIDDEGFPGDLRDLLDELADVGALQVDGPAFLLLVGAGRCRSDRGIQGQRADGQAGGKQDEGETREDRSHRFSCFP
ncbi:hypothetical protein D3C71_1620970 [compost metagenome]